MNRFDLQGKSDEEVKALADKGEWIGIFDYGIRMYCKGRYQESFDYLYRIKDSDNSFVWEHLIHIAYEELPGVMSDEELIALLKKRHAKGTSSCDYILAECYEKGRGVKQDLAKYNELLLGCVNDGSLFATLELARNYETGHGVKQDYAKAYDLYLSYYDEHGKRNSYCAYKVACYMLEERGGAKKDYPSIEFHLRFASRGEKRARALYEEIFGKEPAVSYEQEKKNLTIVGENFVGKVDHVRTACRAVILDQDRILTSYETKTNLLMLPGGGIEAGESEAECCKREVEEETGLLIDPGECALTIDEYYGNEHFVSLYFSAKIVGEGKKQLTPREIDVGMEPRWMNLDEMISIFHKRDIEGEECQGLYLREYHALAKITGK